MTTDKLAIDGGTPAIDVAPAWPPEDEDVRRALIAVYEDGDWGRYHGQRVGQLEARLSEMHGRRHAVACASGTFAVELALRALKVGEGDEVVLAGYDFAGNFRAVEAVGARPVLVDLQADSWRIDPSAVAEALAPATRAVVVSHLHGDMAPVEKIAELARQRGVELVEDVCQSPGGTAGSRIAGDWGDVAVFSFGGSKLLTAGRGGAIVTDREDVRQRAVVYCERGNHAFPLSELQAAVLLPQLDKLESRNEVRLANARRLLSALGEIEGLTPLALSPEAAPAIFKLPWLYDNSHFCGAPREAFIAALAAEGLPVGAGFRGFVRRPASRCRKVGPLANARSAVNNTLLLHHPLLLDEALATRAAEAVGKVCEAFRRPR